MRVKLYKKNNLRKPINYNYTKRTDKDRQRQDGQDKTKQENASYDMFIFKEFE